MTYRERCDAKLERMQERQDAGLISQRFPEVSSIVVDMEHNRAGVSAIHLMRTLNFSSCSHAYFRVECLNKDCGDCTDGFHLDQVVAGMIRTHTALKEGELKCEGNGVTSRSVNISYKVTIRYNEFFPRA
ncbi:MAG: hypothetical protein M0Z60_10915 [Nitrospiraceae bacterium]|nr:hypothetical protein [Nitrospiraceae bacterium]